MQSKNSAFTNNIPPQLNIYDKLTKLIKQFMINTINTIRTNLQQQQLIIKNIYHHLHLQQTNPSNSANKDKIQNNIQILKFQKLQTSLASLQRQSEILSEKIFDLNQMMILDRSKELQRWTNEIKEKNKLEMIELKQKYQQQIFYLKQEIRQNKIKYQGLEKYMMVGFKRNSQEQKRYVQDKDRLMEFKKYLVIIQELKKEIQQLKRINKLHDSHETCYDKSQYFINESQSLASEDHYYKNKDYDAKTTLDSVSIRRNQPSLHNYSKPPYKQSAISQKRTEYYTSPYHTSPHYNARQANLTNLQAQPYSYSKKKNSYILIQNNQQRRQRSKSFQRQRKTNIRSNYKPNNNMQYYNNNGNNDNKVNIIYVQKPLQNDRCIDRYYKKDYRQIQSKNQRLRQVQNKLRKVKSNLQYQLKYHKK